MAKSRHRFWSVSAVWFTSNTSDHRIQAQINRGKRISVHKGKLNSGRDKSGTERVYKKY